MTAARRQFGGSPTDFVASKVTVAGTAGLLQVSAVNVTFWSAKTGGTQYTDLLDTNGTAATAITADANGQLGTFQGPNDGTSIMWADGGGTRQLLLPTDTNQQVIRATSGQTSPVQQFFDSVGNPMFQIPLAGGPAVLGDNFRVFNGSDIFNPWIKLRQDGTIQMAKGDPAGGAGVLAIGNVTTGPSAQPDGTHTLDGSTTAAGINIYSTNGRAYLQDGSGSVGELGLPTKRRMAVVQKDLGTTTLSSHGVPAPTLSPGSGGAAAASADNVLANAAIVTVGTSATSGNAAKLTPASFTQTYFAWAPMAWFRISTDTSIASQRWWVGLFSADPSATSTPSQAAAFRYDTGSDGTAFWRTYTQDGATATVTTTTSAIAVSSFYDLRVEVNLSNASVRFLVNDVVAATHTTHLPTFSQALAPMVSLTTLTTTQRLLGFGRMVLTQVG